MADRVHELFDDYAARRARGERPDAREYLERAGDDADELRPMLERLLITTPPPEPSPELVAMMEAVVAGEPPLLGLRHRRGLRIDAVVADLERRLGLRLDVAGRARLKRNYQRLEGGLLQMARLDRRLLAAIAAALGVEGADLLAGARPAPPAAPVAALAFARAAEASEPADGWRPEPAGPPDEIDRLFGITGAAG